MSPHAETLARFARTERIRAIDDLRRVRFALEVKDGLDVEDRPIYEAEDQRLTSYIRAIEEAIEWLATRECEGR